jgi:radical SAM superfamily enzyme YgiQ (UPF0313 family)
MKIFLLNPPFLPHFSRSQRSPGVTKSGTFYYPYWLASAAAFLGAHGHKVRLYDAPAEYAERPESLRQVSAFAPELVVLDTSTPSIRNDVAVAEEIRRQCGCPVVLVGTHVSACADQVLAGSSVDFVARKEYEETLLALAETLAAGQPPATVAGLSYRDGDRIATNPDRELPASLDHLPFVSRAYLEYLPYRRYRYSISRHPVLMLMTSRGCPFQCRFCLYPQTFTGHRFRVRSIGHVVEELRYVRREFPDVAEIFFEDDTFTFDQERVHAFCDALIEAKLRLTWTANARADLNRETLRHMRTAGLRLLCVGFESVDSTVIRNMSKGLRVEGMTEFARNAAREGVMAHGCFIHGNPGDTRETFAATLAFAKSLPLSSAQFLPVTPYPGTRLYEELRATGYLRVEDFSRWVNERGFHNCVVNYPHLSGDQIVADCNRAKWEYHFRPRYIGHKLLEVLRHPAELPRNLTSMIRLASNSLADRRRWTRALTESNP